MSAPAVSTVVPNWNGLRYLDACLRSVLAQEVAGGHEVIVVDNGSSDGSAERVATAYPEVRLLRLERNRGFSAACNAGVRAALADSVVLLDNDTRARPGWLAALLAAAASAPRVGAVASKLLLMDRPQVLNGAGLVLFDDGFGACRGWLEEDGGQFSARDEVFGSPGNGMLLRRDALDEVGLLDEGFFAYYDDADLCWRLRRAGWSVLYEPAAVLEHVHNGTLGPGSDFFAFHVNRNRLLMVVKNGSPGFVASALLRPGWLTVDGSRPQARLKARVAGSFLLRLPAALLARRGPGRVPRREVERWAVSRTEWNRRFGERAAGATAPEQRKGVA